MDTYIFALTGRAAGLARKIKENLTGDDVQLYISARYARTEEREHPINGDLARLVAGVFPCCRCMIFVMAVGIAVRVIAPHVKDKKTDPAVVVLDEYGQFVISLLSGHLGGANRLARRLADIAGAVPVITTASDLNHTIAVDELALENGWAIEDWAPVKNVSSALVNGDPVAFIVDQPLYLASLSLPANIELVTPGNNIAHETRFTAAVVITSRLTLPELTIPAVVLRPPEVVVGIGCRRATGKDKVLEAIRSGLRKADRSLLAVKCLATVDAKQDEPGLLEAAAELGLPLTIITREKIAEMENRFECSPFVKSRIGVGAVAEPAAYLAAHRPRLVLGKTKMNGVTVAVVEEALPPENR